MGLRKLVKPLIGFFSTEPTDESLGDLGERLAARFLKRLGWRVLVMGDRSRSGEIDLIARDDNTLVFCEVKTRRTDQHGSPARAVDTAKQHQLTRAALTFMKRHGLLDCAARFDVLSIVLPDDSAAPRIEHIRNAFDAPGPSGFYS